MLHLGGRIPLGMDIGNLLELQGAFQRHRVVVSAAQIKEVVRVGENLRQRGDLRVMLQDLGNLVRNAL